MQILPYNKKCCGRKMNYIINKQINGVVVREPKALTERSQTVFCKDGSYHSPFICSNNVPRVLSADVHSVYS